MKEIWQASGEKFTWSKKGSTSYTELTNVCHIFKVSVNMKIVKSTAPHEEWDLAVKDRNAQEVKCLPSSVCNRNLKEVLMGKYSHNPLDVWLDSPQFIFS